MDNLCILLQITNYLYAINIFRQSSTKELILLYMETSNTKPPNKKSSYLCLRHKYEGAVFNYF